jgi:hypothetical protein
MASFNKLAKKRVKPDEGVALGDAASRGTEAIEGLLDLVSSSSMLSAEKKRAVCGRAECWRARRQQRDISAISASPLEDSPLCQPWLQTRTDDSSATSRDRLQHRPRRVV